MRLKQQQNTAISMTQNNQMNFLLREKKMEYLASSLERFLRMTVMGIKKEAGTEKKECVGA